MTLRRPGSRQVHSSARRSRALAGVTSFVAKGTYKGYDDPEQATCRSKSSAKRQISAPRSSTQRDGDSTTTYDGRAGWIAAPVSQRPVPVLALAGGDLEGVRLDAELSFPAGMKQALGQWRVRLPGHD